MDIVSKPRIWNPGANAVSLETQPILQIMGAGKAASYLLQPHHMLV
jgi:hypothetical protein